MPKKGLVIAPYLLKGVFEVDISKINSREPLCYAYGELLAQFRKGDALCQEMINFIKKNLENTNEKEEAKEIKTLEVCTEIYAGFKEYDEKNPKAKIIKQKIVEAGSKEGRYFWVTKSYSVVGKSVFGWHFFVPMLVEKPISKPMNAAR